MCRDEQVCVTARLGADLGAGMNGQEMTYLKLAML